ncbi:hypothetical protein U1Q18_022684, partial [Sarracenia purpurea var. burkii]
METNGRKKERRKGMFGHHCPLPAWLRRSCRSLENTRESSRREKEPLEAPKPVQQHNRMREKEEEER